MKKDLIKTFLPFFDASRTNWCIKAVGISYMNSIKDLLGMKAQSIQLKLYMAQMTKPPRMSP